MPQYQMVRLKGVHAPYVQIVLLQTELQVLHQIVAVMLEVL